jgi:ATP-binding cassette subfamily B protein
LPEAPGAALSTFRDDAEQVEETISWTLDQIGTGLFAIIALGILLATDARLTLAVFLPLIGVLALMRLASARIERYRRASRGATSRVTVCWRRSSGRPPRSRSRVPSATSSRACAGSTTSAAHDRARPTLTQVLDSINANTVSLGTGLILLLAAARCARARSPSATSPCSSTTSTS